MCPKYVVSSFSRSLSGTAVTVVEHYRGYKRVIESDLDLERDVGSFEPALVIALKSCIS